MALNIQVKDLNFYYGANQALKKINLQIPARRVTALIGPSGCGKSTFLRCLNRMNDLIPGIRHEGSIELGGEDIHAPGYDLIQLRRKVGMVFQKPNPFPKSIWENVAYGPKLSGITSKKELEDRVEDSLRKSALWDEVKDRLGQSALGLSGGQQQRLCIARALAVEPEVLLMDEPASALDPKSTSKIEDLIAELEGSYTIAIVTHNMQQASRVSDFTAFFYQGVLIEHGATYEIFSNPKESKTNDYITGRFG